MSRVVSMALTVTLDTGDTYTVTTGNPAPGGDNPRFNVAQMLNGLSILRTKMRGALTGALGVDQIVEEES